MYIITGAAGFIGSALVWELNNHGVSDIICVDHFGAATEPTASWKNLVKRSFIDVINKDALFDFLENPKVIEKTTVVIHLGASSSTTEADMDYLVENNHHYSQYIFNWCTKHKKRLVYASSCATYGNGELGFDDTLDPEKLKPLNPYGFSKILFDRWIVKQKHAPSQWVGLRFSNVFGPQEYHKGSQSSVVHQAYHQITKTERLRLFKSHNSKYEDGKQMRDFIYIKDVTGWIMDILQKPSINGIFNMGYGKARTWLDLAVAVFKSLSKPLKIEWIDTPENIRSHYQYFTEAKMEKLWSLGITKPKWTLEEGVEDYIKNYLIQKDSYL